jgi:predicted metalloprotease
MPNMAKPIGHGYLLAHSHSEHVSTSKKLGIQNFIMNFLYFGTIRTHDSMSIRIELQTDSTST